MAREGFFFALKPMTDAIVLNLRPDEGDFVGVWRELDFSEKERVRSLELGGVDGLEEMDHQVFWEGSWREERADDMERTE